MRIQVRGQQSRQVVRLVSMLGSNWLEMKLDTYLEMQQSNSEQVKSQFGLFFLNIKVSFVIIL